MISYFYREDLPMRSKGNIPGRTRYSNVPPVTEIYGDIECGTKSTYVSIVTITPSSPVATNTSTISTNISTTRGTR